MKIPSNDLQRSRRLVTLAAGVALLSPGRALADSPDDPAVRAAAESLFAQADQALERHDYAVACPKLEAVSRLLPGKIGASMRLAECYEAAGRVASASLAYETAERLATAAKDPRASAAHAKVQALAPRVPLLLIAVPEVMRSWPGLTVQRDAVDGGTREWGALVPVDPGRHTLRVSATGKQPWTTYVDAVAGAGVHKVEVPVLLDDPASRPPEAPVQPKVVERPIQPPAPAAPVDTGSSGSFRRPAGIAFLGGGAAGLLVGAVTAGLTASKRSSLLEQCPKGDCFMPSLQPDVDKMHTLAAASTAGFAVGGVLAATGVILVVTAPNAKPQAALSPLLGPGFAGVHGRF
jgi:hypothetical protein